jgi:excisionase family DNA binding protein
MPNGAHAPDKADTPPQWRTPAELAAALKVHPSTILRKISAGEIEAVRFGPRIIRVPEAAAAAFLAKGASTRGDQ